MTISLADVIGFVGVTVWTLFAYQVGRNDQRRKDAQIRSTLTKGKRLCSWCSNVWVTYTMTNIPTVTVTSYGADRLDEVMS